MAQPKFKDGDWGRVKTTAPKISAPGARVEVIGIGDVGPDERLATRFGVPPGVMYICLYWIGDEDHVCFVGESDLEPDTDA